MLDRLVCSMFVWVDCGLVVVLISMVVFWWYDILFVMFIGLICVEKFVLVSLMLLKYFCWYCSVGKYVVMMFGFMLL